MTLFDVFPCFLTAKYLRGCSGLCAGKRVAVKVPLKQDLTEKQLEEFRHEVIINK